MIVSTDPNKTEVELDVSGRISLELEQNELGQTILAEQAILAAGTLVISKPQGQDLEVYGALRVDYEAETSGPNFLSKAGISAEGSFLIGLNTSFDDKQLELTVPGRETETIDLEALAMVMEMDGSLTVAVGAIGFGADLTFEGAAAARMAVDPLDGGLDLDLFVAGRLDVTATSLDQDLSLFSLDGLGLLSVQDVGAVVDGVVLTPTVAGRVDLYAAKGLPGVYKLEGSAQVLFNNSGEEVTYVIPERLQTRLESIQAKREGVLPGQTTLPSLPAVDGKSVVTVPAQPDPLPGSVYTAGAYFVLQFGDPDEVAPPGDVSDPDGDGLVDASLTILDSFKLQGDFQLILTDTEFELATSARLGRGPADVTGRRYRDHECRCQGQTASERGRFGRGDRVGRHIRHPRPGGTRWHRWGSLPRHQHHGYDAADRVS